MKPNLWLVLAALSAAWLSPAQLAAQDITGTWQGTLARPQGGPLRLVAKITRGTNELLQGNIFNADQGAPPIPAATITFQGSTLKMNLAAIGGSYEGKLASDGSTIAGTLNQGPQPIQLNFARATPQDTWSIPDPPPPPKVMSADVKPGVEVATIKPSRPDDARGKSILVGRGGGNTLTTTNTPISELIVMAYGIHPRQLTGAPSWVESDKFDITAKPDHDGIPNIEQLKVMIQALLAERFGLKVHTEKKELSVYALTIAKSGSKLNRVDPPRGNLPGFGGPPGFIRVNNSTMAEFAGFLQSRILERPVVDQTNLAGRFDLQLRWTPSPAELSQLGPNAPPLPPPADDAAADVFAAMERQAGLHLESTKAPVDVLVVDKIEKPSEN